MPSVAQAPSSPGLWKSIRRRLEWILACTLAKTIPLLPRRACTFFAQVLGTAWYWLDAPARRVALANIAVALPDCLRPRTVIRRSFRNSAQTALDVFWSTRITPDNVGEHILLDPSFQHASNLFDQGRGVICVTAHFGNFEWLSPGMAFWGWPGSVVVQNLKNPLLDRFYNSLRSRTGMGVITRDGGMLRLFKRLKNGQIVGLLIDLTLHTSVPSVAVDFFGLKTNVTFLHAMLRQRTGSPIVPVACLPIPGGKCKLVAGPPFDFPRDASTDAIVTRCLAFFEGLIRAQPDLWLWAYKHWRYRDPASPSAYPFYANISGPFTRKLTRQLSHSHTHPQASHPAPPHS